MFESINNRLKKTADFVEAHPTVFACALTFVVTWKMSHDVTIAGVLEQTKTMSYEWGQQAAELELQNALLASFIDRNGLMPELTKILEGQK